MKRGSFFYLLAAGVVVLLLTGIGGCNGLSRNPLTLLPGGTQTPAAVMFVPKQAAVMASLLVNPDSLDSSAVAGRPEARRRLHTELQKLKTSLLTKTGLDYRQDVQPWLGNEITLAVTSPDVDRDGDNGKQTGYLVAIATKDAAKSREFLQLLFSKRAIAGTDLAFEQYKGVKLIYYNQQVAAGVSPTKPSTSSLPSLAGAVVGNDFVLFANNPKVLRDAINNVQAPSLSLASSEQYQQALTLLPPKRIGLTFLNLPVLSAWRGLAPATQTDNSQIIALQLQPQGLLAETSLIRTAVKQDSPAAPTKSPPISALKYVPAKTGFALTGFDLSRLNQTDLSQTWSQVSTGLLSNNSNASQLVNQPLAPLEAQWGIDLPEDIFSWVQGEYALGLLPHADLASDWIFVAEKSDAATSGISRLDAIASSQGLSVSSLTLGEQKIAAWTQLTTAAASTPDSAQDRSSIALKAKVQGVHATVGNYEIFTTSVEAMDEALKSPQIGSLADNSKFQAGLNAIPQPNQGYLYLDWTASQEILERQLPILKLIELVGNPIFSNLKSLTLSSYGNNAEVLKSGVFFQFGGQGA